ncbi:MAG: carboxypeptidase regulatory-like domain-containing protein [Edaphobacter sp.]|uniref:carboxypeptidase regulatory-like domain-containing protein n=1 Tax=Edaphobacter sp. TaxID=1934404 RepID=UPI00239B2ACC|nr:carboxypeptidase regulatory-like domain-containing protein [Edaphobacter sp.]MDE1175108.1 carboxypeptidase regulatory-like domain-containing protein [Edaphobacter sp.]
MFSSRRLAAAAAVLAALSIAAHADTITGTVTNKTNNKPAAGDEVTLIRLAQGMQESTHATTDSKGNYTLNVPDPGMHLIRVTHQKANYFRPAPPGAQSVDIDVYDVATKVAGVVSEADVMRVQTDESGKNLRIVENFFLKNDSNPPKTQFGDRPFEFYLPAGAVVEGSAALAPGGMPVQAAPMPLGDPNHYAFVFPIRPGETRFQITYHIPYSGSINLGPKPSLATDTVAIMMPKSMTFKAGASSPYSPVTEEMSAQTFVARNVSSSSPLAFTISGAGQLPRDSQAAAGPGGGPGQTDQSAAGTQPSASTGSAATDTRPGGGLGTPIDPEGNNDPWAKYKWWILGGLGLAMAAGAGVLLKSGGQQPAIAAASPGAPIPSAPSSSGVLGSLKDELFALETDRLEGRMNEAEYAEQKAAIETVLKRALQRKGQDITS